VGRLVEGWVREREGAVKEEGGEGVETEKTGEGKAEFHEEIDDDRESDRESDARSDTMKDADTPARLTRAKTRATGVGKKA
jgi:hypothetical protein